MNLIRTTSELSNRRLRALSLFGIYRKLPRRNGSSTSTMKRRSNADRPVSPPARKKIQSSTTKDAVSSFFTPASSKKIGKTTWANNSSLIVAHHMPTEDYGQVIRNKRKIAAFDLDSTLIKPTSGKYSKGDTDWVWADGCIVPKLKTLDQEGYQVVLFSNQGGLRSSDPKVQKQTQKRTSDFKTKITTIANQLNIPFSLFAATERDKYRKPRIGMWEEMLDHYDLDSPEDVDLNNSFYVGDAGGRYKDGKNGDADFASSDRDFAFNIGITFHTPEEFFHGHDVRPFSRIFEPSNYLQTSEVDPPVFAKQSTKEIVLFCGCPGAGKSTFYWTQLAPLGYERVNQDILKSREKCLKKATEYLKDEEKSVVVDNTNADAATRKYWIDLARQLKAQVRCILFTSTAALCEHNDIVRGLNGPLMNPEGRSMLPRMAFSRFWARYKEPTVEEGFQDITRVDFKFRGTVEQQRIWGRYWL